VFKRIFFEQEKN